ncbi:Vicianin hydrolase [Glycine soja]|uniref:Vicianin hydrolase n=1 Tax=Glycine soja TaxID=3848 RepID=A0A445JEX0_GLYSO|nr:Vicianin hydrolase [Glycine soja]
MEPHITKVDFHNYADFCFKTFGDRVKHRVTLNEPGSFALAGYNAATLHQVDSKYAGNCTVGDSATEPYIISHNLILAHGTAATLYKKKYQSLRSLVGSRLPKFTKAESASLKGSHDFLGVNYYSTHSAEYAAPVSTNRTFYTAERNGVAVGTRVLLNQGMTRYQSTKPTRIVSGLNIMIVILKDGVNVKGYYALSFSDSFEWDAGYTVRIGLVYVDFKNNLRRYPKYSSFWLKKFLLKGPRFIVPRGFGKLEKLKNQKLERKRGPP